MKQLTRFQSIVYFSGGILLLLGAIMPLVSSVSAYAPYVFTTGTLMFATMQLQQRYEGRNLTVRRLRRQQIFGAFLLLISACLMLSEQFALLPLKAGSWKVVLAVAALLELYTSFRLPTALEQTDN